MIAIRKGNEPDGLAQLREKARERGLSPAKAYALLKNPLKQEVRDKLVEEQGQLCAYCMCKIPRSDVDPVITPVIIEHVISRNTADGRDAGQGLDYNNFVAVCHGNKASRGTRTILDLTCDAHKGNDEFRKINPCIPETLNSIIYTLDGRIDATDPDVKIDLLHTLNLNCPSSPLVAERKSALDSLIESLSDIPDKDQGAFCSTVLDELNAETNPKTPYAGILIWYLKSLIPEMNGQSS